MDTEMTVTSNIKAVAETKRMTLGELRAFLAAADHAGVTDDAVVKVAATVGGHLKSVQIG
jgi:hypothetical protein